jgi:hypothetical protein
MNKFFKRKYLPKSLKGVSRGRGESKFTRKNIKNEYLSGKINSLFHPLVLNGLNEEFFKRQFNTWTVKKLVFYLCAVIIMIVLLNLSVYVFARNVDYKTLSAGEFNNFCEENKLFGDDTFCQEYLTGIANFSAYTPRPSETDNSPFIMASNKYIYAGALACPSWLKFGTKVEIEGLGEFICEDRMNRRYRNKEYFDILMFDLKKAKRFGRQALRYAVLDD